MSKDRELKDSDKNTKYFQMMVSLRRRRKLMVEIKKGTRLLRDPRSIKGEVRRFFKKLYSQKEIPIIEFEDGLVNKIATEDARLLEMMPSLEEIKFVVWSCDPTKASGVDGFNLNFMRKY